MTWLSRNARWLLGGYSVFLAFALFSPTSEKQSGAVSWLGRLLVDLGVSPSVASFARLEVLTNAAIIVPLSFLGSLVLTRWRWKDWTAWAFVGAVSVELIQGLLLPGRAASFSDVVANTAGALLGSLLLPAIRLMQRSRGAR
jgi:glycopeptide antibiotics resistance protein